jgi:hypothetical protein
MTSEELAKQIKSRMQSRVLWYEATEAEKRTIELTISVATSIAMEVLKPEIEGYQQSLSSMTYERDHLKDVLDGANKLFRYLGNLED